RAMIDRTKCLEPSAPESGNLVGRDPRQMGKAALEAAGFERASPMEVIRTKCIDCCAGHAQEVRYCVAVDCPAWPYRMGSNPWSAARSPAQIEAAKKMASRRPPGTRGALFGGDGGLGGREIAPKGSPSSKVRAPRTVASGKGHP